MAPYDSPDSGDADGSHPADSGGPHGADGGDTGEAGDGPAADPAAANPYVDGETATSRAAEAGPLFDEAYRPGESGTNAGLVAGDANDPVLVAGVGYPLLGDLAVGTVVAYRIAAMDLDGVAVADCSNTPVAAYQTITAGTHRALVVVGAEKRGGELNDGTPSESPGVVHEYDAAAFEAPEGRLTELVGESAMGSNTVENVIVVSRALGRLPDDTRVVTVEPGYDSWGMAVDEFTDPVAAALDEVVERVLDHVDADRS